MIKSAIQQKTIGDLLKEKRKERKLTIEQIAEFTKIRVEYLKALEETDYSVFTSEVYVKGFLKNYTKFLGINSEHALALYRRENIVKVPKNDTSFFGKFKDRTTRLVITPNRIIATISAILLIILVIYLSTYIGKVLRKPELKLTTPIEATGEGTFTYTTQGDQVQISGELDTASKVTINGQEVGPANMTNFTKTFTMDTSPTNYMIKAVSPFGRETEMTLTVTKASISNAPVTPVVQEIKTTIDVISDGVTLTVFVDGSLKTDKAYKKNARIEFTALDEIIITANKSSAFTVTINGVKEEYTGKSVTFELNGGQILKN
jgi:cytoskeletal protein RodZ